jgi:hypothetical protein
METHTDTVVSSAAKRSPKARLLTAGHLDGRTRASKRARAIAAELEAGFGDEITKVGCTIVRIGARKGARTG